MLSLFALAGLRLRGCMLQGHVAQAAHSREAIIVNTYHWQSLAQLCTTQQHEVPARTLAGPVSLPSPTPATLAGCSTPRRDAGLCGTLSMLMAGLMATASTAQADSAEQLQTSPQPSIPISETAVHPLDYEPVTNEHTANMTLARNAALEYYQAGKYTQAEAKFLEALAEAKLGFDERDPHIASAMNNVAEFYRNTGQHDKAEKLYLEAMAALERIYGERHWLYVSAMHNLALSHEERGDLDAAQSAMERVMNLRLIMFGARHFLYADSMYALGHILMKQAAKLQATTQEAAGQKQQQQQQQQHTSSSNAGGSWWWGWGKREGGRSEVQHSEALQQRALGLMEDAVKVMEDAESVQANVVIAWLSELSEHYRQRKELDDAIRCMRKAMYHFTNDKGEVHANASQLSDTLIELHLEAGHMKEARDVAATCAAARQQMFGRELAVAQAWLRLAILEAQISQGPCPDAVQHARNAAALSADLLAQYSKQRASGWLARQGQDQTTKHARAAHLYASSVKFLADHAAAPASETTKAVQALETAVPVVSKQLSNVPQGSGSKGAAGLEELADLYVELQFQLVECLDQLALQLSAVVAAGGVDAAAAETQLKAVKGRLEQVAQELLAAAH